MHVTSLVFLGKVDGTKEKEGEEETMTTFCRDCKSYKPIDKQNGVCKPKGVADPFFVPATYTYNNAEAKP